MDGCFWNFLGMSGMAKTTSDSILGVIRVESWILDHFEIFVNILLSMGHKGNRCHTEYGAAIWRTTWPWRRFAGSDWFLVVKVFAIVCNIVPFSTFCVVNYIFVVFTWFYTDLYKPGISNSFGGAGHTARYHSIGGPQCFWRRQNAIKAVNNTNYKSIIWLLSQYIVQNFSFAQSPTNSARWFGSIWQQSKSRHQAWPSTDRLMTDRDRRRQGRKEGDRLSGANVGHCQHQYAAPPNWMQMRKIAIWLSY